MARHPFFSVAHRGASAYAPENTVAAFDEAIRLGAKAVEFDLRITADATIVAIHDDTLDRTTPSTGRIAEQTWTHLRQLDAGSHLHPRFAGTRIPSLHESLLAIAPYARPVLDLKTELPWDELIATLRRFNLEKKALITSANPQHLTAVRKSSRDVPLGLIAQHWHENLPNIARALDAETLLLHTDALGTSQVAAATAHGLQTWAWTLNDVGVIAACAAMGISGILTDHPDLIRTR